METLQPLKTGLSFYLNNLWTVLRRGWIFSILFALVYACLAGLVLTDGFSLWLLPLIIVGGVLELFFYSRCVVMLRPADEGIPRWKHLRKVFLRLLLTVVDCVILVLPLLLVLCLVWHFLFDGMQGESSTAMLAYICLAVIVGLYLLVVIPLLDLVAGSVFDDGYSFWHSLIHIGKTLRRYPLLLATFFGLVFTAGLAEFLIELPLGVLAAAEFSAKAGLASGDAAVLPPYVGYLSFVLPFITGFLVLHCRAAWLFVLKEIS